MTRPTVALAGVSGYGRRHLLELLRLHADGGIELVGLADPRIPEEVHAEVRSAGASPSTAGDLGELLAACPAQTVVIATPPHTHHALATAALRAGSAVYVEKPPVPLPEQLDDIEAVAGDRRVEFGFQQTRAVVTTVEEALRRHPIGEVRRITAYGALSRPDSYYRRAPWAGRRMLGDAAVFDGSLFNPLAHTVHAALVLARRIDPEWALRRIDVELAAVRDLEADDTAAIRATSARGPVVTAVGTTAADVVVHPSLRLTADEGVLDLRLSDLRVRIETDGEAVEVHGDPSLSALERAVRAPESAADPLTGIDAVRPFVHLVATAMDVVPAVTRLPGSPAVDATEPTTERRGISAAILRAVDGGTLLGDTGLPVGAIRSRDDLDNGGGRPIVRHPGALRPTSEVAR